jgi:hypothetical protein
VLGFSAARRAPRPRILKVGYGAGISRPPSRCSPAPRRRSLAVWSWMRSSSSRRRYSSAVMCRPSCVITSMLEVSTPVWAPVPRLIMRRIRSRRAIAEETLEQLRLRFDAQAVYALELWIGESRRPYPMAVIRCGGALRPECRSTALLASRSHPGNYG